MNEQGEWRRGNEKENEWISWNKSSKNGTKNRLNEIHKIIYDYPPQKKN